MGSFKDKEGREWTLKVNGATVKKVYDDTGADLFELPDNEATIHGLIRHPRTLVPILWSLVEEQADKAEVTPASFGESLFGDAIVEAQEALLRSAIDFFPSQSHDAMNQLLEVSKAVRETAGRKLDELTAAGTIGKVTERATAEFEKAFDASLAELQKALDAPLDGDSTNTPEFSDLTPTPEPSAN